MAKRGKNKLQIISASQRHNRESSPTTPLLTETQQGGNTRQGHGGHHNGADNRSHSTDTGPCSMG